MKLYIDTSDREKIVVGIDGKNYETNSKEGASQKLLPFIEEILKKNKKTLKDIKEIEVNKGPGSFTGLRVGIAIANTLAWQLNILVNHKKEELDINY
jgi:tRNA threonylcarbamoyladenosine biosynthesis protein TsaB